MGNLSSVDNETNRGFTLVELMVVLVIIAILVAIAVPIYSNTKANAQRRACQANLRLIDGAAAAYFAGYGELPESVQELVDKGYLKSLPHCPAGNEPYSLDDEGHAVCNHDPPHSYR